MWNAELGMLNVECGIRNMECGMLNLDALRIDYVESALCEERSNPVYAEC